MCLPVLPRLIDGKRYRDLVEPVPAVGLKRDAPRLQAQFNTLVGRVERDMGEIARAYAGTDTIEWYQRMYDLLLEGHTSSVTIGRALAGSTGPSMYDRSLALAAAQNQATFLQGYLDDIQDGEYDTEGGLDYVRMGHRNRLYAAQMRGTANEAYIAMHDPGEEIHWIMTAVEDHCTDCPEWAAMGPYTRDTLAIYPGDGSTECLGNCLCVLRTTRGTGLARPF